MIMARRPVLGMAEQRLLPRPFAAVLPNRRTPWTAIVVTTVVAMALTVTGSLANLADLANTVVLLLLLVFLRTNGSVLVLRRDRVAADHFRVPAVVPVLALGSCVLLLTQQEAGIWPRAGILLAVGVALYFLARAPWWRGDPDPADDRASRAAG